MTHLHQRRALRRTALAGVAVAALTLTAGCGGSSKDAGGQASTSAHTSAHASANGGNAFAPGAQVDAATVKKMFTDALASASTVHVQMTMAGQIAMSGSGDMDMKSKPMTADLQLTSSSLGNGTIRMIMVHNAMYLHMAALGDKYIKVSLDDPNSPLSKMGLGSLDPTALFDRFADAVSGGTYVGKETVAGTPTDHYTFTLDTKAIASAMPSLPSSAASKLPATEKVDVWFDGQGRYKQMKMVAGGETVTETFSDWGKPVSVTAPPAKDTQDMTSLLGGMASGVPAQ